MSEAKNNGGIMDLISSRVSCRSYLPDSVPHEHILRILEAARLAPSACNCQPWRFTVVQEDSIKKRIVEEGFLAGIKMKWALEAPVFIVIGMETSFLAHHLGVIVSGIDYPWVDIGIAGEHLVLAAEELGLGTCWIGWINTEKVRKIAGWPKSVKTVAIITVGYPAEKRGKKPAERRKVMDEIIRWI